MKARSELRRVIAPLLAVVLTAWLTGCGGAHSVPSSGSAAPLQGNKAQATFRIDIPKSAATVNKRSAQYVSPATSQMVIDIAQNGTPIAGYPVTVGLTPTSGGCSSTLASTYCQLTVALAPGNYMATLTTEDASNTPLSSAQSIAVTISAGANNLIPITLSGIPYALQVTSGARAVHGDGTSGLTLYGTAAELLLARALDADGNIIVGPGAPTFSASVINGNGWSAGPPASTSPNTIAITPPGANGAGATFSITAAYSDTTCSQPGAVCSATFTIKNDVQTLFVGNSDISGVHEYAPPYTGSPTAINSRFAYAMVLDGANDLFIANRNLDQVTELAPPYTGSAVAIIGGLNYPTALVIDNVGNLFVALLNGGGVDEFAPPYTGSATTISNGIDRPAALLLDSAENLFVADQNNGTATEYAPPYTGSPTTISGGSMNNPAGLALDAAANLFVLSEAPGVTEYAPPYTGAPTTTLSFANGGVDNGQAIVVDSVGDLFVANDGNSTVTEYAPPYTGSYVTITNGVSSPEALAIDGAGDLFVANFLSVTEYAPPYTGAPIATISNGVFMPASLLLTP